MVERCSFNTRLQEIQALPDGWFNGSGKSFDSVFIRWIGKFITDQLCSIKMLPYIYPIVDGGISAEWDLPNGSEFHLVFLPWTQPSAKSIEWYYLDKVGDADSEGHGDMSRAEDYNRLLRDMTHYLLPCAIESDDFGEEEEDE